MAKIKHTKNELKAQREALERFERFLPMLQLKKQQLQGEIQRIGAQIDEKNLEEQAQRSKLRNWIKLFSEEIGIEKLVVLKKISTQMDNIAGVSIPVLADLDIKVESYDLFETPLWVDSAVEAMKNLVRLRVEREILEQQKQLIADELRTTSQRVNLFEKVKIPECKENIRIIKIFLGDEQTASVMRGKIAKKRTLAYQYEDTAA